MNIEEAREILQTCSQKLQGIRDNLEIEIPPSMAPVTTNFFFDQLECAMENIECRDYDLERLIKSKSETTDLELLIDDAYDKYLKDKRKKEHAAAIKAQKDASEGIAKFTARLHEVIAETTCNTLGIKVLCNSPNKMASGNIIYRQTRIVITFGPYSGGEWGIQPEDKRRCLESMTHVRSENLLKALLLQMAFIRERANNANGSR